MDAASLGRFKSRFLVGVLSTGFGTLAPMIIALAGVMLILRWTAPEDYGAYLMLVVLVQLFSTFSEFGVRLSLVRNLQHAEDIAARRQMIGSALWAALGLAVLASIIAMLGQRVIFRIYDFPLLHSLIWYLVPFLVLTNLNNIVQGALQGLHSYTALMALRLLMATSRFVMVIVFLKYLDCGVQGLLYADLISIAFSFLGGLLFLPGRSPARWSSAVAGRVLRFGLPLHANNVIGFLFNRVDVMMIGSMTNAESVAGVEVAARIPNSLKSVISTSFMSVFYPHMSELLARGEKDQARRLLEMSLRLSAFCITLIALGVAMLQDEIVVLLFSGAYLGSGLAFSIFMMALSIGMSGTLMGMTLVAAGHPGAPAKINLVAVTANIIGNLILIPVLGFTGAALATFGMTIASLPVNYWFLRRKLFRLHSSHFVGVIVLGLVAWGLRYLLDLDGLAGRLLLIVAYPLVCFAMVSTLRSDLRNVWGSVKAALSRR